MWCAASQGPGKGGVLYGLGTSLSAIRSSTRTATTPQRDDNNGDGSLKEKLKDAFEKIDVLTREKEDMQREIEEVKQEEERKRKEFEQKMEAKRLEEEMKRVKFERMILDKIEGARGIF